MKRTRVDELAALAKYTRLIADSLGLRDWDLRLSLAASSSGTMAEVAITQDRRLALISVSEDFADYTREEKRDTVIHELLHVVLNGVENCVEKVEPVLGGPVFALLRGMHRSEIERAVDALASAISPKMPLP